MKTIQQQILAELKKINGKLDLAFKIKENKAQDSHKELTFQELLDKTGRKQYTNKDVVNSVQPCEPQKIEFFKLDKYISCDNLEKEYSKRKLIPVSPYALALYSLENEKEMDEKQYVGTQWKDKDGFCYSAFGRWCDERYVRVGRYDNDWYDYWWFGGVRK